MDMDMDTEAVVEKLTDMAWAAVVAAYEDHNIDAAELLIEVLRENLRVALTVIHQPAVGSA